MSIFDGMLNEESKGMRAEKMMILDLDEIERNELNHAPIEGIDELMEDIRNNGNEVAEAITVYKVSNHRYKLISGERRFTACKKLGHETIRANIIPKPETVGEELELIDRFNAGRPQTKEWTKVRVETLATAYDELKKEGLMTKGMLKVDWISTRLHGLISPRTVQEYLTGKYSETVQNEDDEADDDREPKIEKLSKYSKQLKKLREKLEETDIFDFEFNEKDISQFEWECQQMYLYLSMNGSHISKAQKSLEQEND